MGMPVADCSGVREWTAWVVVSGAAARCGEAGWALRAREAKRSRAREAAGRKRLRQARRWSAESVRSAFWIAANFKVCRCNEHPVQQCIAGSMYGCNKSTGGEEERTDNSKRKI